MAAEVAALARSLDADNPPEIHAVQWDAGHGEIECVRARHHFIKTLKPLRPLLARFKAAASREKT